MTLLVAVIRAKQNETDYFLNPDFNACRGQLSEEIAQSSSLQHRLLQELFPVISS